MKLSKMKVIKIEDNKELWSQEIRRAIKLDEIEIPYQFVSQMKKSSSQKLKDFLGIVQMVESRMGMGG